MGSAIMSLASFNRRFVEIIILASLNVARSLFFFFDLKYIFKFLAFLTESKSIESSPRRF